MNKQKTITKTDTYSSLVMTRVLSIDIQKTLPAKIQALTGIFRLNIDY